MDPAQVERVRRALRRRAKPSWRVLWRGTPAPRAGPRTRPRWRMRPQQLQAGWKLLWAERVRRDLDPIYRLVACRRGRHRDAYLLADDLIGSHLADENPELAVCEVCDRVVEWPHGKPSIGSSRYQW
jgi:hypothetical protein